MEIQNQVDELNRQVKNLAQESAGLQIKVLSKFDGYDKSIETINKTIGIKLNADSKVLNAMFENLKAFTVKLNGFENRIKDLEINTTIKPKGFWKL